MGLRFNKDGTMFKPSAEHSKAFTGWGSRESGSAFSEAKSNLYRKWYVQGQADYRAGNAIENEGFFDESANEAWLMGWQADAEVERRGLQLAPLGIFLPKPTEEDDYEPSADMSSM